MHIGSRVGLMNSDFRNIEFRNILAQTAPAIQPEHSGSRPGEHAFGREDHYSINALQQHHRDSKPVNIRENNEFASRIQSLMSGDVALGKLQEHHGAGPSSVQQLLSSSPMGMQPNGGGGGLMGASGGGGAMQVGGDAQNDQSSRAPSRYEAQKRRDWNTFGQYLRNHRPPLALARCTGQHVLEFVRYLDQFGKTKVHTPNCPFFGLPHPPHPCPCPLRQAWGSLDALIGRLRAAFEENGGKPESNPFGARQVRLYLREVREMQAKARGIAYEKKKRKRMPAPTDGGPSVNMNLSNGMSNGNIHALPAQQ